MLICIGGHFFTKSARLLGPITLPEITYFMVWSSILSHLPSFQLLVLYDQNNATVPKAFLDGGIFIPPISDIISSLRHPPQHMHGSYMVAYAQKRTQEKKCFFLPAAKYLWWGKPRNRPRIQYQHTTWYTDVTEPYVPNEQHLCDFCPLSWLF